MFLKPSVHYLLILMPKPEKNVRIREKKLFSGERLRNQKLMS